MDASEREFVLQILKEKRELVLSAIAGFTPEQRAFRPRPDCWSVSDCVEHITLVETRVMDSIERQLNSPPEPEKAAAAAGKEQLILRAVPERSTRVTAPEAVRPTGRWPDFDELLGQFGKARDRSMKFAAETQADLRSHFFPHFVFRDLDCYQWLVFLGAHTERHVLQIEEIRADHGFPR